jgi:hypothetical protein
MKMKKLATALLIGSAVIAPAHAGVKTYYRSGAWENYAGTNNEGGWTCGMSVANRDWSQSVHIKYFLSSGHFEVQIFKMSWRIPNGTDIPITLGFDRGTWGTINKATGSTHTGDGSTWGMINFYIADESVIDFLENVAHADKMWLKFLDGNETPWVADMRGSRNSVNSLQACVAKAIRAAATPPSQPYSGGGNTQPFAAEPPPPPAPTFAPTQKPARGEESF